MEGLLPTTDGESIGKTPDPCGDIRIGGFFKYKGVNVVWLTRGYKLLCALVNPGQCSGQKEVKIC